MIGVDTNILVRYLVQDDPVQSQLATRLLESVVSEKNTAFVSVVVLIETMWVLERCYNVSKDKLLIILQTIIKTKQFTIENANAVKQAIEQYNSASCGFSDCVIHAVSMNFGCSYVLTFDVSAQRCGMKILSDSENE